MHWNTNSNYLMRISLINSDCLMNKIILEKKVNLQLLAKGGINEMLLLLQFAYIIQLKINITI